MPSKIREGEAISMPRIELPIDTHVFHAFLRFETSILADEKDKKKFLDFALKSQQEEIISVMAFVILDDEVDFLLGIRERSGAGRTACSRLKYWERFIVKEHPEEKKNIQCRNRELKQEEEILEICRYIHMLPLTRGYVKRIRDYWWSSYQTYRGCYFWKNLDTGPLLGYFGRDIKKSRIHFLRYHRRES